MINGTIKSYHKDGTLHFTDTWIDGVKHGYSEFRCSDGNISYKGYYINGERHGEWEDRWSNGEIRYYGFYDMGERVNYRTDVRDKLIEMIIE